MRKTLSSNDIAPIDKLIQIQTIVQLFKKEIKELLGEIRSGQY